MSSGRSRLWAAGWGDRRTTGAEPLDQAADVVELVQQGNADQGEFENRAGIVGALHP